MNDKLKWSALVLALLLAIGLGYAIPKLFGSDEEPPTPAQQQQEEAYEKAKQEVQQSIDTYLELAQKSPMEAQPLVSLASSYYELGQLQTQVGETNDAYRSYKNALDNFNKYLALKPTDVDAQIEVGLIYNELRMYEIAVAELKKVVAADPKHQRALLSLGFIYSSMQSYSEAKTYLTQAYNINPSSEIGQDARKRLDQISQMQAQAGSTTTP